MRFRIALVVAIHGWLQASTSLGLDPCLGNDPYWILLHEPAVIRELQLSDAEQVQYRSLTDRFDQEFFPLRNRPQAEATRQMQEILNRVKSDLQTVLTDKQRDRIEQILFRKLAAKALLTEKFVAEMRYSPEQQAKIQATLEETEQAVTSLYGKGATGKTKEKLAAAYRKLKEEERERLLQLLTEAQMAKWMRLLGDTFPLASLGKPALRVPELIDSGEWINAGPITLKQLRGKVVLVHFYASDCINCIHNYPTYLKWQDEYQGKDVALIGIQTPEVKSEHDPAHVRKKAEDAGLQFPILIDLKSKNWNAWGNSMWPAVYLVDKQGYLRDFWAGELKWEGATGDVYIQDRIEELRAEVQSQSKG